MRYLLGEEVEYEYNLIQPEDAMKLQAFSCGNKRLDYYIHNELIQVISLIRKMAFRLK